MSDEQVQKIVNAIDMADRGSALSDINDKLDAIISLLERLVPPQE